MRQKRNRVRRFFWAGLLGLWVFFGLPAVVSASETGLNEEIADLFQLSIETVKNQKKNAMRLLHDKLGDVYGLMLFIAFNV